MIDWPLDNIFHSNYDCIYLSSFQKPNVTWCHFDLKNGHSFDLTFNAYVLDMSA